MPLLSTFSDLVGLFLYISSPCLMVALFLSSSVVALIPFPIPTSFPQPVSLPFLPVPPLCQLTSLTHSWLGEEQLIHLRLFRYVTSKKLSAYIIFYTSWLRQRHKGKIWCSERWRGVKDSTRNLINAPITLIAKSFFVVMRFFSLCNSFRIMCRRKDNRMEIASAKYEREL